MGIIDFREICSPNRTHKSVKNAEQGLSNDVDDFELFCGEFFTLVKKFTVFKSVANGQDNGIDLGVIDSSKSPIRWLVSCKHKAHSGKPVSENEQKKIIETVSSWDCKGFIAFYTTSPTVTLSRQIEGAAAFISVIEYTKERIERDMLLSAEGIALAARYFPKSMTNHYSSIVSTIDMFKETDVNIRGYSATLNGARVSVNPECEFSTQKAITRLIHNANITATMKAHKPYFEKALVDAVQFHPSLFKFERKKDGEVIVSSVEPNWCSTALYQLAKRSLHSTYFISSVWSFWDSKKALAVFSEFKALWRLSDSYCKIDELETLKNKPNFKRVMQSEKEEGFLTIGTIGILLQEKERDIASRLFAFAQHV